jgi:aspartyl protease family protein
MGPQDREHQHEQGGRDGRSTARHLLFLVIWLVVMGVGYFVADGFLAPPQATVTAQGDLRIPRARNGHFYVDGTVNGKAVEFLVDTGASSVVVSERFAQGAGLEGGVPTTFQTANGLLRGRTLRGVPVTAGPLALSATTVGVGLAGPGAERALLGQSFLSRFDVTITGQEMVIRRR